MTQQPVLLTVPEVVEELCPYFKVGPYAIRRWIATGRLGQPPAVIRTPGGQLRIRAEAVEAVKREEDPTEAVRRSDAASQLKQAV